MKNHPFDQFYGKEVDQRYETVILNVFFSILFLTCCFQAWGSSISKTDFLRRLAPGEKRVCLSLRILSEQVTSSLASGSPIPPECLNLAGIGFLEGYMVDKREPNDIILFGLASKDRLNLRLDDLLVNMYAVVNSLGDYPYCSLDPTRESIVNLQRLFSSQKDMNSISQMKSFFKEIEQAVGPQQIVIGGVPRNSRHAHVMINADYHMKKVSQGHIAVNGVSSYLDNLLNDVVEKVKGGKSIPQAEISLARFWFHIGEGSPRFQRDKDIVAIQHCNMVILTQKQKETASGELVDIKGDDPYAIDFANEMSKYFANPGAKIIPDYADLENLYRLRSILLSLEYQGCFESVGWSFSSFISEYVYQDDKPMEPSLPGLANYKEWTHEVSSGRATYTYMLFPMICGGVGMDMIVDENSFRENFQTELSSFRMAALLARRSKNDLSWSSF